MEHLGKMELTPGYRLLHLWQANLRIRKAQKLLENSMRMRQGKASASEFSVMTEKLKEYNKSLDNSYSILALTKTTDSRAKRKMERIRETMEKIQKELLSIDEYLTRRAV